MTELDAKLQEIAVKDWDKFANMVGEDALTIAKVCLLKQSGNTYGQISQKVDKPRRTVISMALRNCKSCHGSGS